MRKTGDISDLQAGELGDGEREVLGTLTVQDMSILEAVKFTNPSFFQALLEACKLFPGRSNKYSEGNDPFINFKIMGNILQEPTEQVFKYYIALKFARALVQAGDFEDESTVDTLLDMANYSLLWAGYVGWE